MRGQVQLQADTSTTKGKALPTGKEVLVVEDDPRVRNMLASALKEMGFAGTFCASAEAATRAIADGGNFDILILDLNLPGAGGMEFLESVRRQDNDIQTI